jgi:hypothetical protein
MSSTDLTSGVARKTIRFAWKDGPTKGKVHEHVFHPDGTVEWHDAGQGAGKKPDAAKADAKPERPKFADEEIAPGIRLVSYLASSGFTLTVVLNSQNGSITGVASNDKTWMPIHGAFEVVS